MTSRWIHPAGELLRSGRRAAPLRDSAIPLEDPEIEAHMARATVFLDRYEAAAGGSGRCWSVPAVGGVSVWMRRGDCRVQPGGRVAFGIAEGGSFAALRSRRDRELFSALSAGWRRARARRCDAAHPLDGTAARDLRVSPVDAAHAATGAGRVDRTVGPEDLAAMVQGPLV